MKPKPTLYSRITGTGSFLASRRVTNDQLACVLFGDGAGAIVLEASDTPGILATELHADGRHVRSLCVPGTVCGGRVLGDPFLRMDGPAVFKLAVGMLDDVTRSVLERAGRNVADVDWLIPHQANSRILQARPSGSRCRPENSSSPSIGTPTLHRRRSRSRSTSQYAAARSFAATRSCSNLSAVGSPGVECCSNFDPTGPRCRDQRLKDTQLESAPNERPQFGDITPRQP